MKECFVFLRKLTGWMMFGFVLVFASACNESEVITPRAAEEKPQEGNCDCEVLRGRSVDYFLQNKVSVEDLKMLKEVCLDITEVCVNKIDEVLLRYCLVAEPQAYFRLVEELIEVEIVISNDEE